MRGERETLERRDWSQFERRNERESGGCEGEDGEGAEEEEEHSKGKKEGMRQKEVNEAATDVERITEAKEESAASGQTVVSLRYVRSTFTEMAFYALNLPRGVCYLEFTVSLGKVA